MVQIGFCSLQLDCMLLMSRRCISVCYKNWENVLIWLYSANMCCEFEFAAPKHPPMSRPWISFADYQCFVFRELVPCIMCIRRWRCWHSPDNCKKEKVQLIWLFFLCSVFTSPLLKSQCLPPLFYDLQRTSEFLRMGSRSGSLISIVIAYNVTVAAFVLPLFNATAFSALAPS